MIIIKKYSNLEDYMNQNRDFFSQPIVKGFFQQDSSHEELLEKAIILKDENSKRKLDSLFLKHFSLYRLVKYIATLSHFYSIDFDKRLRQEKIRFPVILDRPIDDLENESTLVDLLIYEQQKPYDIDMEVEIDVMEVIENDELFFAFNNLTEKERQVLHLIIIENKKQVDIARLFDESPQNVAKTKKRALKKIQRQLKNNS
ncbi:sigma-70 family RNA polymerase sigma factor [Sutcliffiella horikoshii]|uniref:Sigma-70 family RNA polymerase sigma factor n=1 Tax=Sutcliffiella horikoshii TaxID=79883 RepID=A0A5D4S460_9BACI|nr:sigma-70 family RNA polymerase sigma factor [Sutcliffiella horikoshii]TYS58403.1 sigma-70 family RNA polymerase sigma factor [Sutcliffiella horikoshii]